MLSDKEKGKENETKYYTLYMHEVNNNLSNHLKISFESIKILYLLIYNQ